MDMTLRRFKVSAQGCFSYLYDASGTQVAVSVSHAYPDGQGGWAPKIPSGRWLCMRGTHVLDVGLPFETFEITGVPGHSGLLFHTGNTEMDSMGCECLGESLGELSLATGPMDAVLNSRSAFQSFMALQEGYFGFWLTVEGP